MSRLKRAKPVHPLISKSDILSNFERDVKKTIGHELINQVRNHGSVSFRVARALCDCRKGMHHGGWMPPVKHAAAALEVDERSVRLWVWRPVANGMTCCVDVPAPLDSTGKHLAIAAMTLARVAYFQQCPPTPKSKPHQTNFRTKW
jgi:hypothetical protein